MAKNNYVICPNKHYYDANLHASCPLCGDNNGDSDGKTEKINPSGIWGVSQVGVSLTEGPTDTSNATMPASQTWGPVPFPEDGLDPTVTIPQNKQNKAYGFSPAVGWLICIEGAVKGKDYRLHEGYNYIGRQESMDVYIEGDNRISRKRHAMIGYEPRTKTFLLAPTEGQSFIYLNDQYIMGSTQLNAYDIIQIGETKLMFVPLCGDKFNWE